MLRHEDLKTITVHTDWDLPLINRLMGQALFFCENGSWEDLQEVALELLERVGRELKALHRPLKKAYNNLVQANQVFDFDMSEDLTEEELRTLEALEQTLADELLDYYADPEFFVIVHAVDEDHGDEAWFLCFRDDVEDLDKTITA